MNKKQTVELCAYIRNYGRNKTNITNTSVSFLSSSSSSASDSLDRLWISKFCLKKIKHIQVKIQHSLQGCLLPVLILYTLNRWQRPEYAYSGYMQINSLLLPFLTLWRSESCWWRSRASLVGNCRRHSRQTILVQSVVLPCSSAALSELLSSGSLSPLKEATRLLWNVNA